jgi:ssDNA-binding replication factor A large subunit
MVQENYERILARIVKSSGLERGEIEKRVEAKRSKLSGLISLEGAAQIIAAELGISFDNEKLKLNELSSDMRKVNVVGKVMNLSPVRTFTTKKGDEGKVVNLFLADDTSNVKVVLWDTHHIGMVEKGEVSENKVIEILNGSMRDNELHLGSFSELKLSGETFDDVKTEKVVKEKSISDFKVNDNATVRAFIVQAFEPRFFNVCPECKKKVVSGESGFICGQHNEVIPEKRALINIVLDDGTESIRSVLFHETISSIGLTELEDTEKLLNQKQDLLGKEMVFSGTVRMNSYFNNPEFIVNGAQEVNLDELISKLEKN